LAENLEGRFRACIGTEKWKNRTPDGERPPDGRSARVGDLQLFRTVVLYMRNINQLFQRLL
jgi:hypothetical protein